MNASAVDMYILRDVLKDVLKKVDTRELSRCSGVRPYDIRRIASDGSYLRKDRYDRLWAALTTWRRY